MGAKKVYFVDKDEKIMKICKENYASIKTEYEVGKAEFVIKDIASTLNIPFNKLSLTKLAPNDKQPSTIQKLPDLLPTKPYLLYVGVAFPHKNLLGLAKAWKIFTQKYDDSYKLVFVGKENYFYKKLKSTPLVVSLKNKPIFTGFVPDEELEAMQYNIPVLSSDRTCMPEILKDAALYFDPENPDDMADKIHLALNDETLRIKLIKNGKKIIQNYSWKQTAQTTLDEYQKVDKS